MIDFQTPYETVLKTQSREPAKEVLCVRMGALEPIYDSYLRYYNPHLSVKYTDVHSFLTAPDGGEQVVILVTLREIAPALWENFYLLKPKEREEHVKHAKELLVGLIRKAEQMCARPIFFLLHEEAPVQCKPETDTVQDLIGELNDAIRRTVRSTCLLSTAAICENMHKGAFYDAQMLYRFGCPFSRAGCNALAYHTVQALKQTDAKKCIVCDCDGVLWGGILAEDGYDGIVLSGNFKGRAYRDFQRELTRLAGEGVLLCLASKNEEGDVQKVLRDHPDMLLREEHIAAMQIHYGPKSESIRALAEELNISPSDMVFLDDSEYEIGLVRAAFPDTLCIRMEAERPYTYASVIRALPCFGGGYLTKEDRTRTQKYREAADRNAFLKTVSDISVYHASLKTRIDIHPASSFDLPRTAQLAARTHQFNLSDSHPSLLQLKKWSEDPHCRVLCMCVSDIYGDMGQVGAAVMRITEEEACIEHFWLSCRAFGRGFEEALLKELRNAAEFAGCRRISGIYTASEKNRRFSDFYRKNEVIQT